MGLKSFTELLKHIDEGAVIITPNNRLSHEILQQSMQLSQKTVIKKPVCLSYQAFLMRLYQHMAHLNIQNQQPLVLSAFQEHHLWLQVVLSDGSIEPDNRLIHEIQKAYAHCKQWDAAIHQSIFTTTEQTRLFQHWALAFEEKLKRLNAISHAELPDYCARHLKDKPYNTMVWACFDDYNPAQTSLQNACENLAIPQIHYDVPQQNRHASQFVALDEHNEMEQMIAWINHQLSKGRNKIGVVIPDVQKRFNTIKRAIHQHFSPKDITLSLGEPLKKMPLVAHALIFLSLDLQRINHETARILSQTPYIGHSRSEFIKRSELLQFNPFMKENDIPFKPWLNSLKEKTPTLYEQLSKIQPYPSKATPFEWIELFKQRLNHLGFPGEYPLDSRNYQIFRRFELLLEEYLQLSKVQPTLQRQEALKALNYLASTTVFQIQKPDTPVIILGLLEASGCQFDSLWISSMDDQCLPEKTKPSAFIPIPLQKELEMPKISPDKELSLAKKTISRFQSSSKESIFSFARLQGDKPGLASPLIRNLPVYKPQDIYAHSKQEIESYQENYSHPLPANEQYNGGSALLGNQAKCPFRAYAAHRLHAKGPQDIHVGPDAMERGKLIHKVMELIWQQIKTQSQLNQLSQTKLEQIITQSIEQAINHEVKYRTHSFSNLIQTIENTRLKTLVNSCLEWEKTRPPFSVEALEKEHVITLGALDFKVRIDRLDRVGGNFWVIDYKTTMPTSKPWLSNRPEEPQLLLYALLNEHINGLLFLQLKSGQLMVGGITEEKTEIDGLKPIKSDENWQDHQHRWAEQLTQLAQEFKAGHCPPAPSSASACQWCDFPALCRIGT